MYCTYASARATHSSWREDEGKYRRTNLKAEAKGGIQHRNKCSCSDHWVQFRAKIGFIFAQARVKRIMIRSDAMFRLGSHDQVPIGKQPAGWSLMQHGFSSSRKKPSHSCSWCHLMDVRKMRGHWGQGKVVERLGMYLSRCRCVIMLISTWRCSY